MPKFKLFFFVLVNDGFLLCQGQAHLINRPGVAGAVLQTALSFIN